MDYLTAKVIITIYVFLCQIDDTYLTELTSRIRNGTYARKDNILLCYLVFFCQVSLWHKKENFHNCGGTIISNNWILTAAHCLIGFQSSDYDVVYGSATLCKEQKCKNVIAEIDQFIIHESYSKKLSRDDIGLIKLKENLKMGKLVKWIRLNIHQKVFPKGTKATVMGWGRVGINAWTFDLQYANINVIPDNYCRGAYKLKINSSQQMCAGIFLGETGDCKGDSGGPLIVGAYQVGIVSFAQGICAEPGFPSVFTRVSAYIDWIYKTTSLKKFKHC